MQRIIGSLGLILALASVPVLGVADQAVEQGTITVTKTWAAGQEPNEVVEVCFVVSADPAGDEVLGEACTADETYTVLFGPTDPDLQTGVTYYVREDVGPGWAVTGDNPVAVVIPDTTGEAFVAFENRRDGPYVEVHQFVCPPGFESDDIDDYDEACHAEPRPDVAMSAEGPGDLFLEGTTDDQGVVVFTGFEQPGEVTIAERVPTGDFAGFVVGCARVDTEAVLPIEYRTNGRAAVAFDLPTEVVGADGGVLCEWYNIPSGPPEETASLTIHKSSCPEDVAPGDRFALCHANGLVGLDFVLDGPVQGEDTTAGHLGAVRWDGLPAGVYTVAEAVPTGEFVDYAVFCARTDSDEEVLFERTGDGRAAVQVEVGIGAQVVCDWYNIAPVEVPLLDFRIAAFNCPTDPGNVSLAAGNIPASCEPAAGAAFTVADPAGTPLASCTAGPEGICAVRLPNEAAVVVTEDVGTIPAGYAPRENPIETEVRTEFAGALFINLPEQQLALTFAIEPTEGRDGETVAYRGEGYTPGGEVTVVMTGDGLIVAEDQADASGAIAGSFPVPERDRLTGEATNDIPVWAIDEAAGRESDRVAFTYIQPLPTATPSPASTPTPTPTPVEGRPVHVHAGSCVDLAASPRYPLTDLATPEATAQGVPEASVAEASYTVIAVPLDDLLADPHAINAHLSDEEMEVYVVCGEIGGPRRADGSVAVGLRELNSSGLTGIAYLAPDPADPDRTQVSVFLAPGLAEEDPTLLPPAGEAVVVHAVVDAGPVAPEFQAGYEVTIYATGRAEVVITPPGASPALDEEDRTADEETYAVQLSEEELIGLLADLEALGFFDLTPADEIEPDNRLVGGPTSRLTVTLVDGTWEVDATGLPPEEADVLEEAQGVVADAVGGVTVPEAE